MAPQWQLASYQTLAESSEFDMAQGFNMNKKREREKKLRDKLAFDLCYIEMMNPKISPVTDYFLDDRILAAIVLE